MFSLFLRVCILGVVIRVLASLIPKDGISFTSTFLIPISNMFQSVEYSPMVIENKLSFLVKEKKWN